jgi:dihydroxyacetone kinase-like protein
MPITPTLLPDLIEAIADAIEKNADEVTALDQAIGDGDHVFNLQRGIKALIAQSHDVSLLDWPAVWQKIGMTLMTTIGGASGSLYGTLFIAMSKAAHEKPLTLKNFATIFAQGVDAVKLRGKADAGEKTMLDVYIPVADCLLSAEDSTELSELLKTLAHVAEQGVESTRDMVATKGRASFLGERSKGHLDAGAKTGQLMICALINVISQNFPEKHSTTPT